MTMKEIKAIADGVSVNSPQVRLAVAAGVSPSARNASQPASHHHNETCAEQAGFSLSR